MNEKNWTDSEIEFLRANDPRCIVSESRIYKRLKRGMTPEQAISEKNWGGSGKK
jgi:hypothetical protein